MNILEHGLLLTDQLKHTEPPQASQSVSLRSDTKEVENQLKTDHWVYLKVKLQPAGSTQFIGRSPPES